MLANSITIDFTTWFSVPFSPISNQRFPIFTRREKNLQWHLEKITTSIDEARNLLDTIPMQKEALNRIKDRKD